MMKEMDYNQAYKNLEKLVDQLADGDVPLEKLKSKVEKANAMLKICENKLRGVKDDLKDTIGDDETE